jgi:hypothetical protein
VRLKERRAQQLRQRVRSVEQAVAEIQAGMAHPQFVGAALDAETLADYYQAERAKGNRFVKLVVHPDLADDAVAVVDAVEAQLRGLSRVAVSDDVPECGWKVVPDA